MNSLKYRRRVRQMKREKEKKEKKENRTQNTKRIIGGLVTAGVAYAGYQYRDEISEQAGKTTSSVIEGIAEKTGNVDFKKRVQEQMNVFSAVSETYRQEEGGAIHTFTNLMKNQDPAERQAKVKDRIKILNKSTEEIVRRKNIPQDIRNVMEEKAAGGRQVFQEAQLKNLEDILRSDTFEDSLGERADDLLTVARDSTKRRSDNLFSYTQPQDDGPVEVNTRLMDSLLKFNKNEEVDLDLGFESDEDIVETAVKFQEAISLAKERTREQEKSFRDIVSGEASDVALEELTGNRYADEKLFEESVRFKAFADRDQTDSGYIREQLKKEGWDSLTIGDSDSVVVERDGNLFVDFEAREGKTVDEVFSPSHEGKIGFGEDFKKMGRRLGVSRDEVDNISYSQDLYIDRESGQILNTGVAKNNLENAMDFLIDNFETPVININPLHYLKTHLDVGQDESLHSAIYREGDVSAFTGGTLSTKKDLYLRNEDSKGVLDREYIHVGENIYEAGMKESLIQGLKGQEDMSYYERFSASLDENLVAEGYEVVNTRKGIGSRYADVMSGRVRESAKPVGALGRALAFDSDQDTILKGYRERVNNFENANFGRNQPISVSRDYHLGDLERVDEGIQDMANKMRKTTVGLSHDSFDEVEDMMAEAINKDMQIVGSKNEIDASLFKSSDGLLELTRRMSIYNEDRIGGQSGQTHDILRDLRSQIANTYKIASEDPDTFFSRKMYDLRNLENKGNIANLTGANKGVTHTGEDMLRGLIQEYGAVAMEAQGTEVSESFSTSIFSSSKKTLEEISELVTKAESTYFGQKMENAGTPAAKSEVADQWINHFSKDENFINLDSIMGKVEPFGKQSVDGTYESLTNTSYMAMKKHKGLLRGINEGYKAFAGNEERVFKETIGGYEHFGGGDKGTPLTPIFDALGEKVNTIFGQRGEVDTASVLPWNLANNLNRGIEKYGLGLSSDKRQSAAAIVGNIALRRMLAPIVAYNTAKSMDDFFLGGAGRRQLAQGYANMHLGVAGIRDKTGMTALSEWADTYVPGMEHLRGSPIGMRASKLSFGLLADGRSEEELEEYYRSGTDPIRKGRWWQMGSTTPWIGERVEYYRPNAYRRIMSDYEYTDTMHGSRKEYWQNHWMPNIYNPMAPLKHFITDPYHYEKKHSDSRPYAVTGGFASLQAIPVVGSTVDAFASSILKPSRDHKRLEKAHEEYLREQNESLISAYTGVNTGGVLNLTPRGKANLSTAAPEVSIMDEDSGFYDEQQMIEDDMRFSSQRERMGQGITEGNAYGLRRGPITTIKDISRNMLASFNTHVAKQARFPANYNPSMAGVPQQGREPNVNMVHNEINPYRINQVDNVVQSTGLRDPAGQFMYSVDQVRAMGGLFAYLSLNASGLVSRDDRIRLEDSSRYRDFNEGFWSKGLGGYDGIDGGLSEIGRRFTGAQQKRRYYNPIRNEMPEWMPSQDYFIDFQHGDPYKKVDYGEIRLPGEAYESIHKVQKDEFGNYSAFDRYKILADVAPYSDEYRMAKSEVALLNQNDLLSEERQDEYRTIRKQVTEKNKKHKFEPTKFKNAETMRKTVTVGKIINQNTFMAKEYPNNPIKLAGVSIKADDEDNVALMRSILKPGSKVEIELDADPMNRERDDMLDTMRAVVYAPKYAPFRKDMPLRSGQNVNQYLSKQSEEDGGTINVRDDGSAVATAALHSEGQITVGKINEVLVHDILPNIPVLNVVADKFYPVRTAVDEYEGKLYGKDFRSWHRPIKHWIGPMLETGAKMNPALAAIRGAGIVSFFSRKSEHSALFAQVGASVYGTIAGVRSIVDAKDRITGKDDRWVPKRRKEQREFDEYFDRIQYIKYKGLYEQAKTMALEEEGVDIDAYLEAAEEEGQSNDQYKTYLEGRKKELSITRDSAYSETIKDFANNQVKDINEKLKDIDNRRPSGQIGSYTALAFRYKEEYESTLEGAKDTYDYMKIYRAMPKHDKEFFTAFQKATPKERQKILTLVPKNQRNIYRRQWGLEEKPEDDVDLEEYFDEYKLPDEGWEGWRPDVSLENIKVKVMQNEGMELTEANYWDEHEERADMDPSRPIKIEQLSRGPMSKMINQGRLKKALEGAGLKDVRIGMRASASDTGYFNTQMDIIQNREEEITEGIRTYMNS